MATPPHRTDQRDSPPRRPAKNSNRGLYIGIAVVVVLLILLFFGGFFTDDTMVQDDATGTGTGVITSDPDVAAPDAQPDATATETDTAPPDTPDANTPDDEEVIILDGDAEVEIEEEN